MVVFEQVLCHKMYNSSHFSPRTHKKLTNLFFLNCVYLYLYNKINLVLNYNFCLFNFFILNSRNEFKLSPESNRLIIFQIKYKKMKQFADNTVGFQKEYVGLLYIFVPFFLLS